jgi:hypothetical protein
VSGYRYSSLVVVYNNVFRLHIAARHSGEGTARASYRQDTIEKIIMAGWVLPTAPQPDFSVKSIIDRQDTRLNVTHLNYKYLADAVPGCSVLVLLVVRYLYLRC